MSTLQKARKEMHVATEKLMVANAELMKAIKSKKSDNVINTLRLEEDQARAAFNKALKVQQSKI